MSNCQDIQLVSKTKSEDGNQETDQDGPHPCQNLAAYSDGSLSYEETQSLETSDRHAEKEKAASLDIFLEAENGELVHDLSFAATFH